MTPSAPPSAALRNFLFVATFIGVVALVLGTLPLSMSPMIFDSGESPEAWGIFLFIWAMPAVLVCGLVLGWIGFARRHDGMTVAGLILAALPVLGAIGILVLAGF